ncbi:MAG: right-handed parallel beta-helix repeat-containing protein, partial [Clostridia bacterium]|nr:right-handed parallel beta-helix repeat-containing protein [Clostridia bacterium]
LYTEKVIKTGLGRESDGAATTVPGWDNIRNPESDVYGISGKLADCINGWATLDVVWMFGFWKYDWADASTLIGSFDYDKKELSPKFVSMYGTKKGAPYYFFNVFEELDSEGEWYLDRDSGIIYIYPDENFDSATIDLTLTVKPIINANADYLTFADLTVKGTRGDAVNVIGNNVTVKNCLIKNVAGNAAVINGYNNLISENEITHTGRGGIIISGGDRVTLTPGNSKADNNLIHDWSEIYQTYQPAVTLNGVGNICSHNEIYNSPHEAITYGGNNHLIEYNVIHDVCLLSDDAGAIYAGRRWDWYGTVIRYNCIYNLGSDGHTPDGIYMDDALSGQTIYGNLLINIPKIGLHLGGGRDLEVHNNIIINSNDRPISYDQRAIDGVFGGWFTISLPTGSIWENLYASPWKTELWQNTYPGTARLKDDFNNTDDPDFAPNPSYSSVTGNLIVNAGGKIGSISEKADKYSDISENAVYRLTKLDGIFNSPAEGDYTLKENSKVFEKIPGFENLPISEMGRY